MPSTEVASIKTLSFTGPSRVTWTGKEWKAGYAAYYTPTVTLNRALAVDMEVRLHVKEDRRAASDPHLGTIIVRFLAGERKGSVRTENNSEARQRGFPAVTNSRFWLVVTKKGRIRGGKGGGDDGHANVYLEAQSTVPRVVSGQKYMILAHDLRGNKKQSARKSVKRLPD